jgi:hypothetical protein
MGRKPSTASPKTKTRKGKLLHTSPIQAVPAIVLKENTAEHFDAALREMVREMNCRMELECISVQREKATEWTVMGTVCREFVVLTLDKSCTSFHVLLLLPFEFELVWFFRKGGIKADIEDALRAVWTTTVHCRDI